MSSRGLVARLERRIRWMRLNRMPGIQVARSVYIAKTAMLQLESDGQVFGGNIVIAAGVTLSDGVILATYGGAIELAEGVYVGPHCVLYGHGGLAIGRDTSIGANTVIIPASHGFSRVDVPMNAQPMSRKGIRIDRDVWIGSGCTILDGAGIGRGSVIGAGAVVRGEIEDLGVAVGVPARVIRTRQEGGPDRSVPPES
jgi:acetyltransferase-like isoleucine patch superfamily enzyme